MDVRPRRRRRRRSRKNTLLPCPSHSTTQGTLGGLRTRVAEGSVTLVPIESKYNKPSSQERVEALRYALNGRGTNNMVDIASATHDNDPNLRPISAGAGSKTSRSLQLNPTFRTRKRTSKKIALPFVNIVEDLRRAVKRSSGKLKRTTNSENVDTRLFTSDTQTYAEWLPAMTVDGRNYFWNPINKKVRWAKDSVQRPPSYNAHAKEVLKIAVAMEDHLLHQMNQSKEERLARRLQSLWRGFKTRQDFLATRRKVADFLESVIGTRRPSTLMEQEKKRHRKQQQKKIKRMQRRAVLLLQRVVRGMHARKYAMSLHKQKLCKQLYQLWTERGEWLSNYNSYPLQAAVMVYDYAFAQALLAAKADPDGHTCIDQPKFCSTKMSTLNTNAESNTKTKATTAIIMDHKKTSQRRRSSPPPPPPPPRNIKQKFGASSRKCAPNDSINNLDHQVMTPLALAAKNGDIAFLELLMRAGANLMKVTIRRNQSSISSNMVDSNRVKKFKDPRSQLSTANISAGTNESDMHSIDHSNSTHLIRPPCSPIEGILWHHHKTLIPSAILDSYYQQYDSSKKSLTLSLSVRRTHSTQNNIRIGVHGTKESKVAKFRRLKTSPDLIAESALFGPDNINTFGIGGGSTNSFHKNLPTLIAASILTSSEHPDLVHHANVSTNSSIDNNSFFSFFPARLRGIQKCDWRVASRVSLFLRLIKSKRKLVNGHNKNEHNFPLSSPFSGKDLRSQDSLQLPPTRFLNISEGLASLTLCQLLHKQLLNADVALTQFTGPARGFSRVNGFFSVRTNETQLFMHNKEYQTHQDRNKTGYITLTKIDASKKKVTDETNVSQMLIAVLPWARRISLTHRAAEQSKQRDASMKVALAKMHGDPLKKAAPPKTIETVWGRIIAQSTVVVQRWSERYYKESGLFRKLAQKAHDVMQVFVADRRKEMQRKREVMCNSKAEEFLTKLPCTENLKNKGKANNRLALHLENLFGDTNSRLLDKAKIAERQISKQEKKYQQRAKAGGAAQQMQMLYRRRKARQIYNHLKHLRSTSVDIPRVHTTKFKLSNIVAVDEGESSKMQTMTPKESHKRAELQEFLLHKCVSGDVEYVCDELRLFSSYTSAFIISDNTRVSHEGDDEDELKQAQLDYINSTLLRRVFWVAAQYGYLSIIKLLVSMLHLDPQLRLDNVSGATALHYAAENNHKDVLAFLASSNSSGHFSPGVQNIELVHIHMKSHAHLIQAQLTEKNCGGHTPLHLAVQERNIQAVKILLKAKANINATSFLAVFACSSGEFKIMVKGERTGTKNIISSTEANPKKHRQLLAVSPLDIACSNIVAGQSDLQRKNAYAMFLTLLSAKASVNKCRIPPNLTQYTKFVEAAVIDYPSCTSSVDSQRNHPTESQGVESDAEQNGDQDNHRNLNTPLHISTEKSTIDRVLINRGPLFYAVKNAHPKMVLRLLQEGADADEDVQFLSHAGMYGHNENDVVIYHMPLMHFAVVSFNPNASSYTAAAISTEYGYTSISQQLVVTIDTLLDFSRYYESGNGKEKCTVAISSDITVPTQSGNKNRIAAAARMIRRHAGSPNLSLLDLAIEQGNFNLARFLCDERQGLIPTQQTNDICCNVHHKKLIDVKLPDRAALIEAAESGDIETIKLALAYGTPPHVISKGGITPLMAACSFDQHAVVSYLLQLDPATHRGEKLAVSVAHQAGNGNTALLVATYRGLTDMVAQLLKFAQEEDRKNSHYCTLVRTLLSAQLPDGSDALMVAVQENHAEIVRVLLSYGVDANGKKPLDGICALYMAAGAGNVDIINLLLNPPSLQPQLLSVMNHLHPKVDDAFSDLVMTDDDQAFLSKAGQKADMNNVTKRGSSALHVAVQRSHVCIVDVLLAAKADLNMQSQSGSTPLALAVFHCDPRLVEILLAQQGVQVDIPHSQGNTEAMMAAFCGDVDILTMLVDAGASVNRLNEEGENVESILRSNHNLSLKEAREKAIKLRQISHGALGPAGYGDFAEAANEAFGMCDTSGDGLISVDELSVFLKLVIDPEKMRGGQIRAFVRNEFNRLDHDEDGNIDFAEFRSCFGRYYLSYKALHFGPLAKEAYLLCVLEQLCSENPNDAQWVQQELSRLKSDEQALRTQHIDKSAFATFINLVADRATLKRSNSRNVMKRRRSSHFKKQLKSGRGAVLLDGSNPKFEALVEKEFNILDIDKGGTIDMSEFYSCFGRYYYAFLPHSELWQQLSESIE